MRRVLALLASLLLASAAEPPTKRAFLMLGGATQILDADGKVTWKYPAETRDGCVLPNGHVLLTLAKSKTYPGGAVIEVTRDLKVVFEYKGTQAEVNTAQRLPDGRTMLTEAGANPRILEVDATGRIQVEIPLQCSAKDPHFQSRMTRKQPNGHYLVPQDKLVRELDPAGKVVWEYQAPASKLDNRTFCALRNAAGHTLLSLTVGPAHQPHHRPRLAAQRQRRPQQLRRAGPAPQTGRGHARQAGGLDLCRRLQVWCARIPVARRRRQAARGRVALRVSNDGGPAG